MRPGKKKRKSNTSTSSSVDRKRSEGGLPRNSILLRSIEEYEKGGSLTTGYFMCYENWTTRFVIANFGYFS
jgi:hypothetical protein